MLPVDVLYATQIEGVVVALRESDNKNFLKFNGLSRNLNIFALYQWYDLESGFPIQPISIRHN